MYTSSSDTSLMNPEAMVLHQGQTIKGMDLEDSNSRTTSPTVLLHANHPDCAGSPLAQSQSTLSTTSPLSFDYRQHSHYNHSNSMGKSPMANSVPMPVRSSSWAAPEGRSPANSVPSMITTEHEGAPSFPSFKTTGKTSLKPSTAVKRKQNVKKSERAVAGFKKDDAITARKQKRLERNRESARLSRRRRKQYLEVLEDKVTLLSLEMDEGRRSHASAAIQTVLSKRRDLLNASPSVDPSAVLNALETSLSRTSNELSVLNTFQLQQLKSFALPAHTKFVLWLTLQGDVFFRGGRAASERLSAARIGERMLLNGNDKATPQNSMWPLFCNEVALSYDQEEKVRNFQKLLLQESPTWLERHSARASSLVMQSFHDSLNAVGTSLHKRERSATASLHPTQTIKFLAWAEKNGNRIHEKLMTRRLALRKEKESEEFKLSPSHHVAANLYILNHRLQNIISQFPEKIELVNATHLHRLSRRPSFESLGQLKDDACSMSRENSFASSSSLRRNLSSLSMVSENGEEKMPQQVSPEDGERVAAAVIEKELGFVKKLIPAVVRPALPPTPAPVSLPPAPESYQHFYYAPPPQALHAPASAPVHYAPPPQYVQHHVHAAPATHQSSPVPDGSYQTHQYYAPPNPHNPGHSQPVYSHQGQYQVYAPAPTAHPHACYAAPAPAPLQPQPQVVYSAPTHGHPGAPSHGAPPTESAPQHQRKSSFLPTHLNVVPEEMYPTTGDASEDFLMSLVDGDWAIGEGIDMDTAL